MPSVELFLTELKDGKEAERVALLCRSIMPQSFFNKLTIFGPKSLGVSNPSIRFVPVGFMPTDDLSLFNVWMLREAVRHATANHVLFVHTDGYILNPQHWTDDWLAFDYIGSPWAQDRNGGNGGFSLRSRKLMQAVADDPAPVWHGVNEDEWICLNCQEYLTKEGMKFAPFDVAKRFGMELDIAGCQRTLDDVFGFHGKHHKAQVESRRRAASMKTALFIHSFQGANERVKLLWSYYRHSGLDIFGIGRTDKPCAWPEPIPTKDIGIDAYAEGTNLPLRVIHTLRWFLCDPRFNDYTHAMIIEADSIFLGKPPAIDVEIAATMAGMWPDAACEGGGFPFWHTPWWFSRSGASTFIKHAMAAIGDGMAGYAGSPDLFIGKVCHLNKIKVQHLEGTFSKNSLDLPHDQQLARSRVQENMLWFIHGIKNRHQLQAVTS